MSILRIVATPIGNLEDLTFRAKRILEISDFVLCEDTRVTKKLLDHYKIKTPTISYHQHSGELKVNQIISLLSDDKNLALVTDAGTPGISDPGGKLVSLVREKSPNTLIESVPGVSALAAAISIGGIGFDRFLFLGFLPHKKGRQTMLKQIFKSEHSVVIYESKHRIVKVLNELEEMSLELDIKVEIKLARELTKLFESFYSGSPLDVLHELEKDANNLKGEFVVLIHSRKIKNDPN